MGQHDYIASQQLRGIILIGNLAGARQGRKNGGPDRFIFWIGTVGSGDAGLYFIDNTLGCIHLIETGGRTAMKWEELGFLLVDSASCLLRYRQPFSTSVRYTRTIPSNQVSPRLL